MHLLDPRSRLGRLRPLFLGVLCLLSLLQPQPATAVQSGNPTPPAQVVKLIFVHHSTGEAWLADEHGGLGRALRDNNYFVSDTNYGWGPDGIGDRTDIGHWWSWFVGPDRDRYTTALYSESAQSCEYSRLSQDPNGPNQVILFKSCFPNSNLEGNPNDPPTVGPNPLRGEDSSSEHMTVANAKGIYNDLLPYFAAHPEKLFVVITAPPLRQQDTDTRIAANARALNNWLYYNWLQGYPHANVAVFDFYNVLTSSGGSPNVSDAGRETGNHHRWRNGTEQHVTNLPNNYSAYPSDDSHPSPAGGQKASAEFVPMLNVFYHRWKAGAQPTTPTQLPTATVVASRTATRSATPSRTTPSSATVTRTTLATATLTRTATPGPSPSRTVTPGPTRTPSTRAWLPIIVKGLHIVSAPTATATLEPSPTSTQALQPTPTSTPLTGDCPGSAIVLQRGVRGVVADAYIWESSPDYTGDWETLYSGRMGWGEKQTLIRFDLTTLGSVRPLRSARLSLWQRGSADVRVVTVHRILAQWDEEAVTWDSFGGRFQPSALVSFSSGDEGWKSVDVSDLVRSWWAGTVPNNGLLIRDAQATEDEYEEYVACEDSTAELRPKLVICLE